MYVDEKQNMLPLKKVLRLASFLTQKSVGYHFTGKETKIL